MSVELTRRWRELAEKRRAHLIEPYDSGRWKHCYTEKQLLTRRREAINLADTRELQSRCQSGPHTIAAESPRPFTLRKLLSQRHAATAMTWAPKVRRTS